MESSKEPEKRRTLYLPAFFTQCRCRCIPANSCCGCHACCACCDLRVSIIGVSSYQLVAGLALGVTAVITFVEAIYNSFAADEGINKLDTNASTSQGLVFALVIYQQTRWLFTFATGCIGLTCSFSTALVGSYAARILRLARVYLLCCWLVLLSDLNALAYNPQAWRSAATGALAAAGFVPAPIDAYIVYLAWSYQRKLFQQQAGIFEGRPVMRSQAKPKHLLSLEHVAALHVKPQLPPSDSTDTPALQVNRAQQPPSPQSMTDTRFFRTSRTPAQTVVGQNSRRPSMEVLVDGNSAVGLDQQDSTAEWTPPEVVIIQQPRGPWSWLFGRREAHLAYGAQQVTPKGMQSTQDEYPEFELVVKPHHHQTIQHPQQTLQQQQWRQHQWQIDDNGVREVDAGQAVEYQDGVVRADLSQYWPVAYGHIDGEARMFELPGRQGPQVSGLVRQDSSGGSSLQGDGQNPNQDQENWSGSSRRSSHSSHNSVLVHASAHSSVAAASLFARQPSGTLTEPVASGRLSLRPSAASVVPTLSEQGRVPAFAPKGLGKKPRIEIPPFTAEPQGTFQHRTKQSPAHVVSPSRHGGLQGTPQHGNTLRAGLLEDSDTTLLYPPSLNPAEVDIELGGLGSSASPASTSRTPRIGQAWQELQNGLAGSHHPSASPPQVGHKKPPVLRIDVDGEHEPGPTMQRGWYQWLSPRAFVPPWLWPWPQTTATTTSAQSASPGSKTMADGQAGAYMQQQHDGVHIPRQRLSVEGRTLVSSDSHTSHSQQGRVSSEIWPVAAAHPQALQQKGPAFVEQQSAPRPSIERRIHLRQVQSSMLAGAAAKTSSLPIQAGGRARIAGDASRHGKSRMHRMAVRSDQGSDSTSDSGSESEQAPLPSVSAQRDSVVSATSGTTANVRQVLQEHSTGTSDGGPRGFSVREWLFGQWSTSISTDASGSRRPIARSMTVSHRGQARDGMSLVPPPAPVSRMVPVPSAARSDDGRAGHPNRLHSPHRHALSYGATRQERVSSPPSVASPRSVSPTHSVASSRRSTVRFQPAFPDPTSAQAYPDIPPTPSISRSPFAAAAAHMARKLRVPPPLQIPQPSPDMLSPKGGPDAAPPSLQPWQQRGPTPEPTITAPTPTRHRSHHGPDQGAATGATRPHHGPDQGGASAAVSRSHHGPDYVGSSAAAAQSTAGTDASWAAACTFQLRGPTISQRPSANDAHSNNQSRIASVTNFSRQSSGLSTHPSAAVLPAAAGSHPNATQGVARVPSVLHPAGTLVNERDQVEQQQQQVYTRPRPGHEIEPNDAFPSNVAGGVMPYAPPSEGRTSPTPLPPQPPHRAGQRMTDRPPAMMQRVASQRHMAEAASQSSNVMPPQPEFVPKSSFMRGAQMQLRTPRSFKDRGQYGAEVNEQLSRALARMQAEEAQTSSRPPLLPTIQSGVYERGTTPSPTPEPLPTVPTARLVADTDGDAYGAPAGAPPNSGDSQKGLVAGRSISTQGTTAAVVGSMQVTQDNGYSYQARVGHAGPPAVGGFQPRRSEDNSYGPVARRAVTYNSVFQPHQSRARTSLSGGPEQLRPPTPPLPTGQQPGMAATGGWTPSSSRGPTPPPGIPSRPGSPNPDSAQSYVVTQQGLLPTQASEQLGARPMPVWNNRRMQRSETVGHNTSRNVGYS